MAAILYFGFSSFKIHQLSRCVQVSKLLTGTYVPQVVRESELSVVVASPHAVPEGVAEVTQSALTQGRASGSGSSVSLFSFLSGHAGCLWILHPFSGK